MRQRFMSKLTFLFKLIWSRPSGGNAGGVLNRVMPILSILLVLAAIVLALRDLRLEDAAATPVQPHSSGLVLYHVTLDSFDIDNQTVRAYAEVSFDASPPKPKDALTVGYPQPFYCQGDNAFMIDLSRTNVFVGFGGVPQFSDLGRYYSIGGLRKIQDVQPLGPCDPNQPNSRFVQFFVPVQANLYAVGNPRSFPFDRYLIIYRLWSPVLLQGPSGGYIGVLGLNEVTNKLAGFSMSYPSPREIELWDRSKGTSKLQPVTYKEEMWAGRQIGVEIKRGLFMRVITIFLALVVFAYLLRFAVAGEKKESWFPDTLSFFLTVWAIRSALSVGGPHVATLIDYGALCFYVSFIGILLCKIAIGTKPTES